MKRKTKVLQKPAAERLGSRKSRQRDEDSRRSSGVGRVKRSANAANGRLAVRKYVAALPDWQRRIATQFDELVGRKVRNVRRVIKWGFPFYGVPDRGWFVSCGGFASIMKITFFQGASLKPVPPSGSGKQLRGIDLRREDRLNETQLASWVVQAAALPGFGS